MLDRLAVDISLYLPDDLPRIADDIWKILTAVDKDFVPPLAMRRDSMNIDLDDVSLWSSPITFFEEVMTHHVLFATIDGDVAGISSFIPHRQHELLPDWSPMTFVSTTAVMPALRRRGIGRALNEVLLALPPDLASPYVARRTWSTNHSNLGLLRELGFKEVLRLPDHRGPGIDSIYLARETSV